MKHRKIRLDTLEEKTSLALYLRERLESLKNKEKETGRFLAETRETATALSTVLNHLRLEGSYVESNDELKESVFGGWMDGLKKKRGDLDEAENED